MCQWGAAAAPEFPTLGLLRLLKSFCQGLRSMKNEQGRPPGRPRSEATRQSIMQAAAELLDNENYRSISIERIASEAKVGKQSIYRWWDSRADVLLEAFTDRALTQLPEIHSTGTAIGDLEALLKQFFSNLGVGSIRKTLTGLIAEAQLDPEFRDKFYAVLVSARRSLMRRILVRGVESGELALGLDIEMALDLIYGAFWYRLLSGTPDPLDDAFAERIVAALKPILVAR
jgi:AcrR family transcriptional regulator